MSQFINGAAGILSVVHLRPLERRDAVNLSTPEDERIGLSTCDACNETQNHRHVMLSFCLA